MAHPITFKPLAISPQMELMKRVESAPREHAEALLVLWDLLQTAHDQGILDLAQGLIGGKDIIAGKLAEGANLPESVAAIRNGIALARVLGALDPDMLHRLARSLDEDSRERLAAEQEQAAHGSEAAKRAQQQMAAKKARDERKIRQVEKSKTQEKAPSLWGIVKLAVSEDARRGIGFGLKLLVNLGRATRE
jgi:uncharacterized protein YjgD (DUF1641 family)